MTESSDEIVGKRIIEQCKTKKLLNEKGIEDLTKKLASGDMTAEDWRLVVENSIQREGDSKDAEAD